MYQMFTQWRQLNKVASEKSIETINRTIKSPTTNRHPYQSQRSALHDDSSYNDNENLNLISRVLYINNVEKTNARIKMLCKRYDIQPFAGNFVSSSKYTIWNFIPKSLFEQFRRMANFYFLIISLLQLFTDLSPTNEYSTVGPLTLVLLFTMAKEGIEDFHRHLQDNLINERIVYVLQDENPITFTSSYARHHKVADATMAMAQNQAKKQFLPMKWKDLQVGHVVRLDKDNESPADIVILYTSNESGTAMCETSSLDGESNLKTQHALRFYTIIPPNIHAFSTLIVGELRCELPNNRLSSFDGVLKLSYSSEDAKVECEAISETNKNSSGSSNSAHRIRNSTMQEANTELVSITIDNVILRGMKLAHTDWAIGVVVGAGRDSKLMQNMKPVPSKFSRLDRIANRCILLIFILLFSLCCICAVLSSLLSCSIHRLVKPVRKYSFNYIPKLSMSSFMEAWITYLIQFNNLVPISLYISLEIIRWKQARRIESDPLMNGNDTFPGVTARTSNVNEELGQIKYIFCDKTGTLTKNQMLFKYCSIGGIIFDGTKMKLRRQTGVKGDRCTENNKEEFVTSYASTTTSKNPREQLGKHRKNNYSDSAFSDDTNSRTSCRESYYMPSIHGEKIFQPYFCLAQMLRNDVAEESGANSPIKVALPFFRCLLLCHSASRNMCGAVNNVKVRSLPSKQEVDENDQSIPVTDTYKKSYKTDAYEKSEVEMGYQPLQYFGSSPDEVALLDAALEFGCSFESKDDDILTIRIFGKLEVYRVLAMNEFDSVRKCMSIVVQKIHRDHVDMASSNNSNANSIQDDNLSEDKNKNDHICTGSTVADDKGEVLVFAKGADSVMFTNACKTQDIRTLGLHVHYFASIALRTLLLGYKEISWREYLEWRYKFDAARRSLAQREEACLSVAKQLETNLNLVGATGIEDCLQDGVKETIEQFKQGGINVWMLTGDKDETAISVANLCGLINTQCKMIIIKGRSRQDCLVEIAHARRKLKREGRWAPGVTNTLLSLVINGETLDLLFTNGKDFSTSLGSAGRGKTITNLLTGQTPDELQASQVQMVGYPSVNLNAISDQTRFQTSYMLHDMNERITGGESSSTYRTGSSIISKGELSKVHSPGPNAVVAKVQSTQSPQDVIGGRIGGSQSSTYITEKHFSNHLSFEFFLELASQCSVVVACRLSPSQKAQIVSIMKQVPGSPLTLAVGDGCNDVRMLQEAHVGIGVYGHEGMQAVRAADFAINKFRNLSVLLLVHGRWNHRRLAKVILFSFYKNALLIIALFLYNMMNMYSGQTIFDSYLIVGWNVLYTFFPILIIGIFDEDIRAQTVLHYPFVYRRSIKKGELSSVKLVQWILNAGVHAIIAFSIVIGSMNWITSENGFSNSIFTDGSALYGILIIVVSCKAALTMQPIHRWNIRNYISIVSGFIFYLIFVYLYSMACVIFPNADIFSDFCGIAAILIPQNTFHALFAIIPVACVGPDLAISYLQQMYVPTSEDIIQEIDSGFKEIIPSSISRTSSNPMLTTTSPAINSVHPSVNTSTSSIGHRRESAQMIMRQPAIIYGSFQAHRRPSLAIINHTIGTPSRDDMTTLLLNGELSFAFTDFERPTEHSELIKLLSKMQHELSRELGQLDPFQLEEDGVTGAERIIVQPSLHPLTLEFMGDEFNQLEKEYSFTFAIRERARIALYMKIVAVLIPLYAVYEYLWEEEAKYIFIRIGMFVCDVLYMPIIRSHHFVEHYQTVLLVPLTFAGMALTITISDTGKFAAALFPIVVFVVIRVKFLYALILSIFNYSFYIIVDTLKESDQKTSDLLVFTYYMAFIISFGAYACYNLQLTMRKDFLQSRDLLIEQQRSTQILKNMIPEHIVRRMQKGDTVISEEEPDVTILFCDIADFSSIMQRFSPTEVVSLLDRIYSLFDQICHKHGVRKMETVGKTYMACAGLQGKDHGREAALRAVAMAKDMLSCMEKCQSSYSPGIILRVGIHSGRVISGLVGMKKQQFSLFGDTVNTASRMQSTCVKGQCQISQVTYRKLIGQFSFEEREIEVKGKGSMTTYIVGEPLTKVAILAVEGKLESLIQRESLIVNGDSSLGHQVREKFLSSTRTRTIFGQKSKKWGQGIRNTFGAMFGYSSSTFEFIKRKRLASDEKRLSVEDDIISEMDMTKLHFKDAVMEEKYLDITLCNRLQGARSTLYGLAMYALFTSLRDLAHFISDDLLNKDDEYNGYSIYNSKGKSSDHFLNDDFVRNILLQAVCINGSRFIVGLFTFWVGRNSLKVLAKCSEHIRRNILLLYFYFSICVFLTTESTIWRLNYNMRVDASPRYVNLCLDTVVFMFIVSNGGSILVRHAIGLNVLALISLLNTCLICLYNFTLYEKFGTQNFKASYPLVLTCMSVITNLIAAYSVEFFTRRQIWLQTKTHLETMNADRLLYQMLPAAVVIRLKEGETVCDQHEQVGILFSDIKGFTSIASKAETNEVVKILASLFSAFDQLTEKYGVFKMQTIGDAYVIVSGLPYVDVNLAHVDDLGRNYSISRNRSKCEGNGNKPILQTAVAHENMQSKSARRSIPTKESFISKGQSLDSRSTVKEKSEMHIRSHIRALLAVARDMHKEVRKVRDPNTGDRLQMRIGIHIGNIIGGVIGTSTLRYDMWSHDALTANELESNGVPEKILVSPMVAKIVEDMEDIQCTFYKRTDFTNHKDMETFIVEFIEPEHDKTSCIGKERYATNTSLASQTLKEEEVSMSRPTT